MNKQEVPLHIEGVYESIYAGFGNRFASGILDFIFVLPLGFLILFAHSISIYFALAAVFISIAFDFWYNIYLVQKNGGTPGKRMLGIIIIKLNGEKITWKEAFLRHIVLFALNLFANILFVYALLQADNSTYEQLGLSQKIAYMEKLQSSSLNTLNVWVTNIWVWSELIVLLTNERRRALHDFIADTVAVKDIHLDKIHEAMSQDSTPIE